MKIKVGEHIKMGGKLKCIVEIQRDLFDGRNDIVCFDDKTKMLITEVKEDDDVRLRLCDYPYNHNFDHIYNHHLIVPEGYDRDIALARWIAHKIEDRGWKCVTNLKHVYMDGLIPKNDLVVGAIYKGRCRNANYALWKGDRFEYIREKFGAEFLEDIMHPEDDNGFDLFVPVVKTEYKLLTDCPV